MVALGATAAIDPNLYRDDVRFLASPEMRGRATGSPELEKAAGFIAREFKKFGLKPADGNSYYQSFPVTTSARLGKANHFRFTENSHATSLSCPDDFMPFHFSPSAKLTGAVVFVGYGITAPEYRYDDYAGLDVKGKLVLVLRHEPQEFDQHSVFAGRDYTSHSRFSSKASNAKIHGAAGVILINDVANHPGEPDELEKFGTGKVPRTSASPSCKSRKRAWRAGSQRRARSSKPSRRISTRT